MSWFSRKSEDESLAEDYIREHKGLYDHYNIRGVQDILKGKVGSQGRIADISDAQVEGIVGKIRREKGW